MGNYTLKRTIDVNTENGNLVEIGLPDLSKTPAVLHDYATLHVSGSGTTMMSMDDLETLRDAIDVAILSMKHDF